MYIPGLGYLDLPEFIFFVVVIFVASRLWTAFFRGRLVQRRKGKNDDVFDGGSKWD